MESNCKQGSWTEEESMTGKEEESSSCSLMHNLMSNCNMQMQEEECSMCGDVGLRQYLFKCLTCSHRYQHIYCSKFYPYRVDATICNWCLPMEVQLVNIAEIDDNKDNMKVNNSIVYTHYRNTMPDMEGNSNSLIDPQVQKLEKHTKAFEYLLQVAELHDQGHQLDNFGHPIKEDNCTIGKFSAKKHVGRDQINEICGFHEVDPGQFNAKELNKQEPASSMMHQIIFDGCNDDHNRSFYTRRAGDKMNCIRGPSATSTQLRYNHSQLHTYMGHDQIGKNLMNQDTIKKIINLGHDQLTQKLDDQDLGENQTIKKVNCQDQVHDLQEPVKDHQIGCSDGNDQSLKWSDAAAVTSKRARLHKPLQASGSGDHRNNEVDQQKIHSHAAACSYDSDDQYVGKSFFSFQDAGDSTGPAKRLRHRQSAVQIIAGDNDVVTPAVQQRAVAGNNDVVNTAAANDQQRVMSIKQSSPTQHAWSRPAGKRDHLINSPSRAINRRYKLLADVLC